MLTCGSILVSLLWLVEQIPTPPPTAKRQRGRQETYSDKLFVKALIVMIIRRLYTAYALLSFLDQDDPVAHQIRPWLMEDGRFPTRRTWERRCSPGQRRDTQRPSTVHPCAPTGASGTRNIGWQGKSRMPRLIPKRP